MRMRTLLTTVAGLFVLSMSSSFQANAQSRIPQGISSTAARVSLSNTVLPKARLATDVGPADPGKTLESLSVRFNMTAAQTAALDKLLADQQNPASPRYHQWLTPEQFAADFGLSPQDIATVSNWLQAQGLTVAGVARSRTFITFSGTVATVNHAFGVTLHNVTADGEQHISNLTDPILPASIANVVTGVTGLNDFRLKPRIHQRSVPVKPAYNGGANDGNLMAPGDFYTIYDIKPLLSASTPVNGSGITIAVAGQTDISLTDVKAFRTAAALSTSNLPTVKLYGTDPGTRTSDIGEAMLDVEWSGATAPGANILYVNGSDIYADSVTQAIDNDLAPIVTVSYGDCEAGWGATYIAQYNALFKQANAQGQTVLGPSGDSGGADCDYQVTYAQNGLAVDFPASSPYATGVGATEFNEGGGTYWTATDGANAGTALSYIPEQPWNETYLVDSTGALFGLLYGGSGGGGVSQVFSKPAWQVGTGVPADSSRDVPDVSFNGAADHDGYLVCSQNSCANGFAGAITNNTIYGGTSVSTPAFAGILALLEQKLASKGLGNINPTIYGLANSTYASSVFHDTTSGTNAVPCSSGTTDCSPGYANFYSAGSLACPANSCSGNIAFPSIGYSAGVGYDLTTGWGSMDINNMVNDWLLVTPTGVGTISLLNPSSTVAATVNSTVTTAGTVTVTTTVASGTAALATVPSGTVQLLVDNVAIGSTVALVNGSASFPAYAATNLVAGVHVFSVSYSGDANYAGSKGAVQVDVTSTTASDFTISPVNTTVTVASGSTANGVTFTVTPVNGFAGNVNFTASTTSTTLNATYAFSVDPVVISSSTAGTTVLTLQAFVSNAKGFTGRVGTTASLSTPTDSARWKLAGSGVALAGLILISLPRRRRRAWSALLIALISVGILATAGCSGASGTNTSTITNTSTGTYTVTVSAQGTNAAGATITHNSTVTFVVQ